MKLPLHLGKLYRHWNFHAGKNHTKKKTSPYVKNKIFMDIQKFVNERMSIWEKKINGEKPPYTEDTVLSKYRFCNIFRELDRQTIEFHTLLNPLRDNFPLWLLNMFYCRMVARTSTVEHVGFLSFETKENKKFYKKLMSSPRPRFGAPYVFPVSVIQKSKTPTRELFIAEYLPSIMKKVATEIQSWNKKSVYDGLQSLIPIFGHNLYFLWTEVLIDVAYQFPEYIDLYGRFPIGPGSMPTMERIDKKKDPSVLVSELGLLGIDVGLTYNSKALVLSAENWEGIGCEFRKYTNLKNGNGRKRLFG